MKVVDLFPEISGHFPKAVVRDQGIDLGVFGAMNLFVYTVDGEFVRAESFRGNLRVTRAGDVRVTDGQTWARFEFDTPESFMQWVREWGVRSQNGFAVGFPDEAHATGWVSADGQFKGRGEV